MNVVDESEALHARVRAFVQAQDLGEPHPDAFDALASDIAHYQERHIPGFARLVRRWGATLGDASAIPAVPVDAFRLARIATFPESLDVARFRTSGTTGSDPGIHAFRTLSTYRQIALTWGRRALFSAWTPPTVVVALAPPPAPAEVSSLGFMMQAFMEAFGGDVRAPERWLFRDGHLDLDGLLAAARLASARDVPLVVLATGFALVTLLDLLSDAKIPAPNRTVVMPTGGFKGRTREIEPAVLKTLVARAFTIPESHVVGEYGMTELSSQLYEGTLPGGLLTAEPGIFIPPPWLRVSAVDAETLLPVPNGKAGLARFVDLGNVDSAVAIVTQDRVRARSIGIELLGRNPGAPPRGCSLALEDLVLGAK